MASMGVRIEWRSKSEGDDRIVAVEDVSGNVIETWDVDPASLASYLNDMDGFETDMSRDKLPQDGQEPNDWGALVIARSENGDVLQVDPEKYWGGIAYWFRSRGTAPHPYHRDA